MKMQQKRIQLLTKNISNTALIQSYISSRYLRAIARTHRKERGSRMACFANEEIGIELNVNGVYERDHIDALLELIRRLEIDTSDLAFCDVGANIGNHSVYLSRFFKKTYAFEPNPDVFYLLKYNLSKIISVEVFDFGLGECAAELDLYQDEANLGASSANKKARNAEVVRVSIKRFDDVYPEDIPIGLIKIDVEGMEYRVLMGAKAMIEKYRPLIAFEQHMEDGCSAISFLKGIGYTVCWLDISTQQRSRVMWVMKRLLEIIRGRTARIELVVHSDVPRVSHTMLIAVPSEILESAQI